MPNYRIMYTPAAAKIEGLRQEVEADAHRIEGGFVTFVRRTQLGSPEVVLRVATKFVMQVEETSSES